MKTYIVGDIHGRCAQLLHRREDRLAFHHHPLATAIRHVVGCLVFAGRPVPEVVMAEIDQSTLLRPAEDALRERARRDGREKRKDVDAHCRPTFQIRGCKFQVPKLHGPQ